MAVQELIDILMTVKDKSVTVEYNIDDENGWESHSGEVQFCGVYPDGVLISGEERTEEDEIEE